MRTILDEAVESAYRKLGKHKSHLLQSVLKLMASNVSSAFWRGLTLEGRSGTAKFLLSVQYSGVELAVNYLRDVLDVAYERLFSMSPRNVETALIKELLQVKHAMAIAPVKCSAAYLLYGPPGTGKSFVAHALSGSDEVIKVDIAYLDPSGNSPAALMRQIANNQAEAPTPSTLCESKVPIYLADEVDKMIEGRPDVEASLHRFLDEARNRTCIVILTTNNIDKIPAAMQRAGRLTRSIEVRSWDEQDAAMFCKFYGLDMAHAPKRESGYFAGDMIEWARGEVIRRVLEAPHRERGEKLPRWARMIGFREDSHIETLRESSQVGQCEGR